MTITRTRSIEGMVFLKTLFSKALSGAYKAPVISVEYNKNMIGWYPRKSSNNGKAIFSLDRLAVLDVTKWGSNGTACLNYRDPREIEAQKVFWAGIDIDVNDDQMSDLRNVNRMRDLLLNLAAKRQDFYLRYSKSRTGFHLFCKFDDPKFTPNNGGIGRFKKMIMSSLLKELDDLGIHVCSSGSNMWICGGGQETIFTPENEFKVPEIIPCYTENFTNKRGITTVKLDDCTDDGRELHDLLAKKGLQPKGYFSACDIWVKGVYHALKDVPYFKFDTKSPMTSTEPHTNGKFFISDEDSRFRLKLYTFADAEVVFNWPITKETLRK